MIDPGTVMLIGMGLQGIGGLANSGNRMSRQQLAEQRREADNQLMFSQEMGRTQNTFDQVKNVNDLHRQMELAPLRDKVSYMLNQRAGMVPQAFQPRDMMNPQSAGSSGHMQQGGIDPAALQSAMGSYQAPDFSGAQGYRQGSGGVDPRLYGQMMARLGWSGGTGHETLGDPILAGGPPQPYQQYHQGSPGGAGGAPSPGNQVPGGGNPWQVGGSPPPLPPPQPLRRPPAIDPGRRY